MHSPWQTTWRSAWIVGIALLAFTSIQLLGNFQNDFASPVVVLLGAGLTVVILTLVVAIAFRCGLHLSGLKNARPITAIATSAIYLVLLLLLSAIPIETRAVAIGLPTTGQTHHALLMVPIGSLVFAFFVLPLLVSYGISRYMRARASGA
jgi:hypothetical protein